MIAPRLTRLVRVPDLASYRGALVELCLEGGPWRIRSRAVILPSRAAGEQLRRTLEDTAAAAGAAAIALPHFVTRDEWAARLEDSRAGERRPVSRLEREVLLGRAARAAVASGAAPPFTVRPGLVAEMLAFYDALRRHRRSVDDFERVVVEDLSRSVDSDRGAVRMLAQTQFLVAAYRAYEERLDAAELVDEHRVRAALLEQGDTPFTHVVLAVTDRAGESAGLWPADFDLLTRLPGLARIDVVATEAVLASGFEPRVRAWLPEIDEVTSASAARMPALVVPELADADRSWRYRDREEELMAIARRVKHEARLGQGSALSRTAVVVKQPLPYVYLASQVFPAAGVPFQAFDAVPLAAEPMAAALDLVVECVTTEFSRSAIVSLLRSPWFRFEHAGREVTGDAVTSLDRALSDARYLGGADDLERCAALVTGDHGERRGRRRSRAGGADAASAAVGIVRAIRPLTAEAPPTQHLACLLDFLAAYERRPDPGVPWLERYLRTRGALIDALTRLRDAHARFDDEPRASAETVAAIQRWIEQQTFAPRRGTGGLQLVDASAARFGTFETMYLVGLTAREWPESPARSIFYPVSMLTNLGWPADTDVRATERASFEDLLHAASEQVAVSTVTLEDDAIVEPSPFLEDLPLSGLPVIREAVPPPVRIFPDEALLQDPLAAGALSGEAATWLELRQARTAATAPRFHGQAEPARLARYKVSSIDQYLGCPFVFFAEQILGLDEEPDDEESLSPKAQGRFVHEVLEAFFAQWQADGLGAITVDRLEDARVRFTTIVDERLRALSPGDAALQRMRLLGSPVSPGFGDIVFLAEAERDRGLPVVERLLEYSLDGPTALRDGGTVRTLPLAAKADRLDLFEDGTFRVIDYKLSRTPTLKHVVQLPAYAAAARARLDGYRGRSWRPREAAYVAFGKGTQYAAVAPNDAQFDAAIADGEQRLVSAVDGIERGAFPPSPLDTRRCAYCAFAAVCRKDYVGDA